MRLPGKPQRAEGAKDSEGTGFVVVGLWVVAMLALLLDATDGSTLPYIGSFGAFLGPMYFYLLLSVLCLLVLLVNREKPATDPHGGWARLTEDISIGSSAIRFVVFGFGTWLILSGLAATGIAVFGPLQNTQQAITYMLWVIVFVAPCENLAFFVVLPQYLGRLRLPLSAIVFALAHSIVYATIAAQSLSQFGGTLGEIFVLGVIIALVTDKFKFPAGVAVHWVWDTAVYGALWALRF